MARVPGGFGINDVMGVGRTSRAVALPSPELQRMGFDFDEFDAEIAAALEAEAAAVDPFATAFDEFDRLIGEGVSEAERNPWDLVEDPATGELVERSELGRGSGGRVERLTDSELDSESRIQRGARLFRQGRYEEAYDVAEEIAEDVRNRGAHGVTAEGVMVDIEIQAQHIDPWSGGLSTYLQSVEGLDPEGDPAVAAGQGPISEARLRELEDEALRWAPDPVTGEYAPVGTQGVTEDPLLRASISELRQLNASALTNTQLETELRSLRSELGAASMQEGIEAASQRPALARLEALQAESANRSERWARSGISGSDWESMPEATAITADEVVDDLGDMYDPAIDTLDYYVETVLPALEDAELATEIEELEGDRAERTPSLTAYPHGDAEQRLEAAREERVTRNMDYERWRREDREERAAQHEDPQTWMDEHEALTEGDDRAMSRLSDAERARMREGPGGFIPPDISELTRPGGFIPPDISELTKPGGYNVMPPMPNIIPGPEIKPPGQRGEQILQHIPPHVPEMRGPQVHAAAENRPWNWQDPVPGTTHHPPEERWHRTPSIDPDEYVAWLNTQREITGRPPLTPEEEAEVRDAFGDPPAHESQMVSGPLNVPNFAMASISGQQEFPWGRREEGLAGVEGAREALGEPLTPEEEAERRRKGKPLPQPAEPPPLPPPIGSLPRPAGDAQNPEARSMDVTMLQDLFAQQAAEPEAGFLDRVWDVVENSSWQDRATILTALVAAGLITGGTGGLGAPIGYGLLGGAALASQP